MKKLLRVYCILARFASLFFLEFDRSAVAGITLLVVFLLAESSLRSGVLSISADFLAVLFVLGGDRGLIVVESMGGNNWSYWLDLSWSITAHDQLFCQLVFPVF